VFRFATSGGLAVLLDQLKQRLMHFVNSLLFIEPGNSVAAEQIASQATELYSLVATASTLEHADVAREKVGTVTPADGESQELLARLKSISESLTGNTIVGLSNGRSISVLTDSETDQKLLSDINDVFANALKRTKNVWVITVIMTICSFALIVSMILLAVTLAVYTGRSQWGLLLGVQVSP
jgi:hypothetical protein